MIDHNAIMDVLATIPDPEMPISIVDLGLVEAVDITQSRDREGVILPENSTITINILPTFVGCPALDMIRDDIKKKISAMPDVSTVEVNFINDPPWSVDRITNEGRASLKAHGVTVPKHGSRLDVDGHTSDGPVQLTTSAISCPFCGSSSTHLDSPFGPTRCRMIFYCNTCRNSFEHMKQV